MNSAMWLSLTRAKHYSFPTDRIARLADFLAGDAPVAQWIERQVSTLSVGGSSPLGRTS